MTYDLGIAEKPVIQHIVIPCDSMQSLDQLHEKICEYIDQYTEWVTKRGWNVDPFTIWCNDLSNIIDQCKSMALDGQRDFFIDSITISHEKEYAYKVSGRSKYVLRGEVEEHEYPFRNRLHYFQNVVLLHIYRQIELFKINRFENNMAELKKLCNSQELLINQKLWEMAGVIIDKQKGIQGKSNEGIDWDMLREMWFDWLEEQLGIDNN